MCFSKKFFDNFKAENIPVIEMSTLNEEGVIQVRNEACERLLAHRVELKIKAPRVNDVLNRLHLAEPQKRDNVVSKNSLAKIQFFQLLIKLNSLKARPAFIPPSVLKKQQMSMDIENVSRKLERDLELEQGDEYYLDLRSTKIAKCAYCDRFF